MKCRLNTQLSSDKLSCLNLDVLVPLNCLSQVGFLTTEGKLKECFAFKDNQEERQEGEEKNDNEEILQS